jgi:transcriptional regulator with XRE-family HTH domain
LAKFDKKKFDNLKTLGETIKKLRETKKLLLRELAASINVDTAMVSKFEKGERKPTRDQIINLSKALEIDEKKLLVIYFSDKIASDLKGEEVAREALEVAKKKIALLQKKENKTK